jgi:rubredoxin
LLKSQLSGASRRLRDKEKPELIIRVFQQLSSIRAGGAERGGVLVVYCVNAQPTANVDRRETRMKYQCSVCGWIYDPELGDPDGKIPPGTPFEKLPDSWSCPVCGAAKSEFVKMD